MLHKTKGIVFNIVNYTDHRNIIKIYTEKFGLQSYLVYRSKGKKTCPPKSQISRGFRWNGIKLNLFQPLALLDLEVYFREKMNINHIKEIKVSYPFTSIPYNPFKTSIALFITEILNKSIKEQETNKQLFDFLFHAIQLLDRSEDNYTNFHLIFVIQLTKYLGFYPRNNYSQENSFFDLMEGLYLKNQPIHQHFLDEHLSKIFSNLQKVSFAYLNKIKISRTLRNLLLEKLLIYYKIHLNHQGEIKTFKVLQEVME